ncbi:hypothetical protein EV121DRAFT_297167 [Schizophyllum commune]
MARGDGEDVAEHDGGIQQAGIPPHAAPTLSTARTRCTPFAPPPRARARVNIAIFPLSTCPGSSKTHTADILKDLERLTDVALSGQVDFTRIIAAVLATIDALDLMVPGKPRVLLAPLFPTLQLRYTQLLAKTHQIAAMEVAYAERGA